MKFYTYLHRRGDTNEVFYVGKGAGRRALSAQGRSLWWKSVVAKAGGRHVEILAHWPTEAEAFEHEKFLIACFRDLGAPLCNLATGGDGGGFSGCRHTPETLGKMRAAATGRPVSSEARKKISASKAGIKRGPHKESTRLRISIGQLGLKRAPLTVEHRAKISESMREVRRTQQWPR